MGNISGKGAGWSPVTGVQASTAIGIPESLGHRTGEMCCRPKNPPHAGYKKKKPTFFIGQQLVGVCYKTGPVDLWNVRGGVSLRQMPALGPVQQSPVAGCLHPSRGQQGCRQLLKEVPGALLLGDGEGLLHLNLATVCDDHILQGLVPTICLGALHLPHYLLGRKGRNRKVRWVRRSATQERKAPVCGLGGTEM